MVRHEAAEALGAIATSDAMDLLGKFLADKEPAVKESCVVGKEGLLSRSNLGWLLLRGFTVARLAALDMSDYVNSDSFEYADTLQQAKTQLAAHT